MMDGTYLERHDPEKRMARFYAVSVVPTLFGDWTLVREWGGVGIPGTVRADWLGTEEDGAAAMERLAGQKARRGYLSAHSPSCASRSCSGQLDTLLARQEVM